MRSLIIYILISLYICPTFCRADTPLSGIEWQAFWIKQKNEVEIPDSLLFRDQPALIFRKEFRVKPGIREATLHITGLGYYEAYLNHEKIGDLQLDPAWTHYSKRIYYSTFNVTAALQKKEEHCLGVMAGNGWYNPLPMPMWGRINLREHLPVGDPCFIAQLHLEYENGDREIILSDDQWKVSESDVRRNNVYLGEVIDRRLDPGRWASYGYNDSNWQYAVIDLSPKGELLPQPQPPIRITEQIRPAGVFKKGPDSYIVDMGINFAGNIHIRLQGERGDSITVTYGELLYPDGSLNSMTSIAGQIKGNGGKVPGAPAYAQQQDIFILAGEPVKEIFQPRFTFHGFRYVEVSGYKGTLAAEDITVLRMHSDVQPAGSFVCSDPLINQIQEATMNTFRSNIFGMQSDCPHREKFGYGADMLATSEAYIYNFDMHAFYAKAIRDYEDAARPEGGFTETAPFVGIADASLGDGSGPIGWGTFHPAMLDKLYRYYGNEELIREQYPAAKRWMEFLQSKAVNHTINIGLSDHESIAEKPVRFTSTLFYYYNACLMTRFAGLLGLEKDTRRYEQVSRNIRQTLLNEFHHQRTGQFDNHNQIAQSFALYFDLVPEQEIPQAIDCLIREIDVVHQGHIATGMFATAWMPLMLSKYGYRWKAFDVVSKSGFPGWAYMFEEGATSIWEHWAFSDNTFSHNHPMFGSISEWFYKCIGGIQPAPDAIGFNKIIIRPDHIEKLELAKTSYHSIHGEISTDWKNRKGQFDLKVKVPSGCTAQVHIPVSRSPKVLLDGKNKTVMKQPGTRMGKRDTSSSM